MEKHMKIKLVADSSANLYRMEGADFAPAPLKIITDVKEYLDVEGPDCCGMLKDLRSYKGKSGRTIPKATS